MGLLIVTADDFGLTPATSAAIVEAHRLGIVSATSILGNGPATTRTLDLLGAVPDLEIGLHLALVGEDPPVADVRSIPTLVDRRGRLARSWHHLLPRLAAGRVDPDDVRREVEAQLAVITSGGAVPTFVNCHQHLQLWPSVARVLVDVCHDHAIGFVRTPGSRHRGPAGRGVTSLAGRLAALLREGGLATNDAFAGLDEAGGWSVATLAEAVATTPGQVLEVNVHPGAVHDADRARYRWGYGWADEQTALMSAACTAAVTASGRTLVGPSAVDRPQR